MQPDSLPPGCGAPAETKLMGLYGNRVNLNEARNVAHSKSRKHVEGLLVDLDLVALDSGDVGDEVHAALTLFLLELQRDAADWTLLDPLHEVGGEAGDLVAEPLGGDDSNFFEDLLVRMEVECHARVVALNHLSRRFLHGLRTDASHGC